MPGKCITGSSGKFYLRRALRILPAYWTALFLLFGFEWFQLAPVPSWRDLALHFSLLHDMTAESLYTINGPFWTMAVEVQFYAVLPLIAGSLIWLVRRQHRAWAIALFVALWGASIGYSIVVELSQRYVGRFIAGLDVLFPLQYLSVFVSGMLCSILYVLIQKREASGVLLPNLRSFCAWAGPAGIAILLAYIYTRTMQQHLPAPFINTILAVGYAELLLGTLVGWARWRLLLSNSYLRFIGLISYSMYIWNEPLDHYVIMPITQQVASGGMRIPTAFLLFGLITVPFSFMFYYFIERPFFPARRAQTDVAVVGAP